MRGYFACSFCGEGSSVAAEPLAVAQSGWDRLRIVRSISEGTTDTLTACCADHATRLVSRWLVTGNLMSPFARAVPGDRRRKVTDTVLNDTEGETVCEFAVDRESVERLLAENPQFLDTMLHALGDALGRASTNDRLSNREAFEPDAAVAAD